MSYHEAAGICLGPVFLVSTGCRPAGGLRTRVWAAYLGAAGTTSVMTPSMPCSRVPHGILAHCEQTVRPGLAAHSMPRVVMPHRRTRVCVCG